MKSILSDFLTNQIVVDWVAPIITGLILLAIPSFAIKFFQTRKDVKRINDANQRFVNSVRLYIVQKIKVTKEFISDIRSVIIKESGIKDRFIYSEIELRNKLIMDITEDSYINELNKKELIDFTYEIFSQYDIKSKIKVETRKQKNSKINFLDRTIILLIISIVFCAVIQFYESDLENNFAFIISMITSILSFYSIFLTSFRKFLRSDIVGKRNLSGKLLNIFFEEVDVEEKEGKEK